MINNFSSKYLNISGKLLLFSLPIMLIIICIEIFKDKNICQPKETRLENNLNLIKENRISIRKIKLTKSHFRINGNLIEKDTIINDSTTILEIKSMLLNFEKADYTEENNLWEVQAELYLSNNDIINLKIERLIRKENDGKTSIYFLLDECTDYRPNYTFELGNYLEKITNYKSNINK
jgi:hypothetical protein